MLLTKCVQLCTMPVHLPEILILYITNSVSQGGNPLMMMNKVKHYTESKDYHKYCSNKYSLFSVCGGRHYVFYLIYEMSG
jgi:hypothetical protein